MKEKQGTASRSVPAVLWTQIVTVPISTHEQEVGRCAAKSHADRTAPTAPMEVIVPAQPARLVLVTALVVGVLALPAAGEVAEGCYELPEVTDVEFCERAVWFTPSETKAGNLGATGVLAYPTWDEEEPTASVTDGAGGGYAANGTLRQVEGTIDPAVVATFAGTHEGPMDNLDVTLFLFAPGVQNEPTFNASGEIHVDGSTIASFDQAALPLTPAGNAVLSTGFTVWNIHAALLKKGIDPEGPHEITIHVTGYAIATTTAVFVYDTTEVPAGMIFNTEALRTDVPTIKAR